MQKKLQDCTDSELTQIGYNQFERLLALQQEIPQVEQILAGIRELKQQRAALALAEIEKNKEFDRKSKAEAEAYEKEKAEEEAAKEAAAHEKEIERKAVGSFDKAYLKNASIDPIPMKKSKNG